MVRWVVGSIPHGGSTELFIVSASPLRLVMQRPWHVLSCLWDGAYKSPYCSLNIAAKVVTAAGFLSHCLSGP